MSKQFVGIGLMLLAVSICIAAEVAPKANPLKSYKTYMPLTLRERADASNELARDRESRIRVLMRILEIERAERATHGRQSACEHDPEVVALQMLGTLRAAECADALLDRVDLSVVRTIYCPRDTDGECIEALKNIGKPASIAATLRLTTDDDVSRRKQFRYIIRRIEGEELGYQMLLVALKNEKDEKKRERLKDALKQYLAEYSNAVEVAES